MKSCHVRPPSAETYTALCSHLYAQLGLVGVASGIRVISSTPTRKDGANMASPKPPEHVTLLPLTDPNEVREVLAHDFIVNVRDDLMHVTFTAMRPSDFDPRTGKTTEERIVTGRVVMSATAAGAMADCVRQILTAVATHKQTLRPN